MYKDTITLFNIYTTGEKTYYIPTVIDGVDLNGDKAFLLSKYGENSGDKAKLHIRYADKNVAGKTYLSPKDFKGTALGNISNYITFAENDIFIKGEYSETIIDDDDFIDSKYQGFYDWLNDTLDNVFTISSCAEYTVIPHFEILGK